MRARWRLLFVTGLFAASSGWTAVNAAEKIAAENVASDATPVEKATPEKTTAEQAAFQRVEDAFYGNRMVISAFEAEVQGDFAARERLLKEAAQLEAVPAARAHLGLINVGTKKPEWRTIDESIAAAAKDENLRRYEKVRSQSPDSAAGHLELAKWCLTRNMDEQSRAHLTRVLDFAPDHAGAREALGFVRLGDKWLSAKEIEQMQQRAAAKTKSIEKHGKTIVAMLEKMKSKSPKERDAALAAFMAFKEVSAVGAVEAALNTPDVPTSKLLIEWMGQVDCVESSLILARYGLMHPDDALRTLAMDKLVTRPLHDFVPELLSMLSSPITMMVQPSYDRQGKLLGYRQAFGREAMEEKDFLLFTGQLKTQEAYTTRMRYFMRLPTSVRLNILNEMIQQNAINEELAQRELIADIESRRLEMERQNEVIKQINERIAQVIAKISAKPLTTKADEMWQWWDSYNDTDYQKYKPQRYTQNGSYTVVPRLSIYPSCFAAGTPVVTQSGLMAIEKINAGDLVLNKDQQTGELNWRPVLKATTRPPFATVSLRIGDETLRCTTGHLFWVSGAGWKKANELKPGDVLHGAKVPARVTFVEPQPAIMTYNLEVADAPNYFVGRNMLLTHDVTPRESNHQTFPGQEMVRQLSEQRPMRKTASR